MTCILLGQVGESAGRSSHAGKAAMVFLTLWFFGNFLLMMNLYQGSIYSFLAVLLPPHTPDSMEELVNWGGPVVDPDVSFRSRDGSMESVLLYYIIPHLLNSIQNPRSKGFLLKFANKVLSIQNPSVMEMVDRSYAENSTRADQTMTFMLPDNLIVQEAKLREVQGNLYCTTNNGDSPFMNMELIVGYNTMLAPYFSREWSRLRHSSLSQMWRKVQYLSASLKNTNYRYGKRKQFEVLQFLLWSRREYATFHEAIPASLDVIRPTFFICATILCLSMAGFMAENWEDRLGGSCIIRLMVEGWIQRRGMWTSVSLTYRWAR